MKTIKELRTRQLYLPKSLSTLSGALALCVSANATAFSFDTGVPELKTRWDTTVKYSSAFRVDDIDESIRVGPGTSNPNANVDDGDRNFDKGLISNRVDLLTEFDIRYQNFGARISGAAWYDDVYNQSNDNDSPSTANQISVPHDEFTRDTEKLHGRKAEVLDAFVYGSQYIGDTRLSGRVGQLTQLYGESLFFGANGIAAAQGPVDLIKLLSVPGSQFKEVLLPTEQVTVNWQLNSNVNVGAYYQFEWNESRLPASGSYLSNGDFVGDGAERAFFPTADLIRQGDISGSDSGQFGAQVKFNLSDWELGLYAAKYHAKTPIFYFRPAAVVPGADDSYVAVYPEDIKVYGASFSTLMGEANIAGEVSVRIDTPLAAHGGVVVTGLESDNNNNPAYPLGNSLHAQLSVINFYEGSDFGDVWDVATLVGEVAFNRRLSVKENGDVLDANATRDAYALRVLFEPQYFQVMPGVDLQVPLAVGYTPYGRSSVTPLAFTPEHGGDFSIGLKADYQKKWYGSLSYTNYFGDGGPIVNTDNDYTYEQTRKDRDFISLSIQRTF